MHHLHFFKLIVFLLSFFFSLPLQSQPLLRTLWAIFGRGYLCLGVYVLIRVPLLFVVPLLVSKLIESASDPNAELSNQMTLVAIIFISGLVRVLVDQYVWYQFNSYNIRVSCNLFLKKSGLLWFVGRLTYDAYHKLDSCHGYLPGI